MGEWNGPYDDAAESDEFERMSWGRLKLRRGVRAWSATMAVATSSGSNGATRDRERDRVCGVRRSFRNWVHWAVNR